MAEGRIGLMRALLGSNAATDSDVASVILSQLARPQSLSTASQLLAQSNPGIQDQGPLRPDGTRKGRGFLGPLKVKGGGVSTEYSVPLWEDGIPGQAGYRRGPDIPTLVPTLTKEEIQLMTQDIIPNRKPIPPEIIRKAQIHARERIKNGLSPFASDDEAPKGP